MTPTEQAKTMSMVERVARAVLASQGGIWDLLSEECQADMKREARAAIEAMREPTELVTDAGWASGDWGPSGYCDHPDGAAHPANVWKSMIDAALSEEGE